MLVRQVTGILWPAGLQLVGTSDPEHARGALGILPALLDEAGSSTVGATPEAREHWPQLRGMHGHRRGSGSDSSPGEPGGAGLFAGFVPERTGPVSDDPANADKLMANARPATPKATRHQAGNGRKGGVEGGEWPWL